MTKQEYTNYCNRVEQFMKREGVFEFSCEENCDPYFSDRRCDCCATHRAGDFHDVTAYSQNTGEVNEYTVCSDCVYFVAYGQLDDTTLIEMKRE